MKYLKKYQLFLEEDEFEVKDTDKEDVKMSKQKLNQLKTDLKEYPAKKTQIDTLYKNAKKLSDIGNKIEDIIGDEAELRNPFLVDYNNIARMSKEVDLTHQEIAQDKIRADDFRQEANLVKDSTTKAALNAKASEVNNRISTNNKKIVDKQKEIQELKLDIDTEKLGMLADIQDNIKKISNS